MATKKATKKLRESKALGKVKNLIVRSGPGSGNRFSGN